MFDKFVNLKIFYEFDLDKLCFFFCFIFFYILIKKETNSKKKIKKLSQIKVFIHSVSKTKHYLYNFFINIRVNIYKMIRKNKKYVSFLIIIVYPKMKELFLK